MEISRKKIEHLMYLVAHEDDPPCVVCGFKCPYSSEKDGHYCDETNDKIIYEHCLKAFESWLYK